MGKRTDQYSLAPYRLEPPSLVFGEFMAIDDGERRLELRPVGPAHTIGDAVAFLPNERILFTGDLCVNWRFGNNVGDRDAGSPRGTSRRYSQATAIWVPSIRYGRRARFSTTSGDRCRPERKRARPSNNY